MQSTAENPAIHISQQFWKRENWPRESEKWCECSGPTFQSKGMGQFLPVRHMGTVLIFTRQIYAALFLEGGAKRGGSGAVHSLDVTALDFAVNCPWSSTGSAMMQNNGSLNLLDVIIIIAGSMWDSPKAKVLCCALLPGWRVSKVMVNQSFWAKACLLDRKNFAGHYNSARMIYIRLKTVGEQDANLNEKE